MTCRYDSRWEARQLPRRRCYDTDVRDLSVIEAELSEISGIPDDITKLERSIAWSVDHPNEVPLALRFFVGNSRGIEEWVQRHSQGS